MASHINTLSLQNQQDETNLNAHKVGSDHDTRYYTQEQIDTSLSNKVDKVTGKGLSTNDYTNEDKVRLADTSGVNTGDETLVSLQTKIVDTDNIPEGDTNQYFTNERAIAANQSLISAIDDQLLVLTDEIPATPIPRDADTLGGELPAHYATSTQINALTPLNNTFQDIYPDQIVYGLFPSTSANLTSTISPGAAYVSNTYVTKTITSHTYTASKDTYVDLDKSGNFTFTEVANGGAYPSLSVDNIRLAKVITNATAITTSYPVANNLYIGYNAGATSQGGYNVGIGEKVLEITSPNGTQDAGMYNTALGYWALKLNTTGNHLVALGFEAMMYNTTGKQNVSVGEACMFYNTTGSNNTAVGTHALFANQTGGTNTAVGSGALVACTAGNNVAIGYYAGSAGAAGSTAAVADGKLTIVGWMAGLDKSVNAGTFTNSCAIGAEALVDNSNTIQLGNANVTSVKSHGSFEAQDIGDGFICKSPDGTRYKITVANGGTIAVATA